MTTTATISARNARAYAAALDEFDGLNPVAADAERRMWAEEALEAAKRAARPYGAAYSVALNAYRLWDGHYTKYFDRFEDAVEYVERSLDVFGYDADYARLGIFNGRTYDCAVVYDEARDFEPQDAMGDDWCYFCD